MNEKFSEEKRTWGKGASETVRTVALAGALLMSHGEVRAFEIKPGSDFETGIQEVYRGTLEEDFESQGVLAVESGANQKPKYTWGELERFSGTTGGFAPTAKQFSKGLRGAISEEGMPFTIYHMHSHNAGLHLEGIGRSKKVYSVPPSALDVILMLTPPQDQKISHHGSRSFSVKYAASDAAGVWFFDRIPTDTIDRSPLVISYMLEKDTTSPIYKWVEANALEGEQDATTIEKHVESLLSGELYRALVDSYKQVGVEVRYTLWSDINENDFPASQNTAE